MAQEKLITLNKLTDFWNKLKEKLGQGINPTTNNTGSIGTSSLKWKDIYATDFHGNASSADKLNTDAGSASYPVYFLNGIPVIITGTLANSISGNAATASVASKLHTNLVELPVSSGSSTYGVGSNGQVLKSNGSTVYWGNDEGITGTVRVDQGGTGANTADNARANLGLVTEELIFVPKDGSANITLKVQRIN